MPRTKHFIKNAQINILFYIVNVFLAFFSRKLFIDSLGAAFLGLNATLNNLLGFLSLAELGLGTAVTYLLYKPLAKKDYIKINEIVTLLNVYYKKIGILTIIIGFLASCFLPLLFKKDDISTNIVYVSFYIYLTINLIEYFFNFKQILVYADQKAFLIKKITGILQIGKISSQIISIYLFKGNVSIFLGLELVFAIIKSICLAQLLKTEYPWLKILKANGEKFEAKQELLKKTKQIFSHQVGGFVLNQTDQLLIYLYTSLKMVTLYNNYLIVIQYSAKLVTQPFLSLNSGVGDLVASTDKEKAFHTFNELLLLKYWIAGILTFFLYEIINPLIELWLGKSYILETNIIILLLLNFFITITRRPLDIFLQAFGIFNDTWAPWAEAILNIAISITLGYFYGIFGVLLGTFISVTIIVGIWKPYLLFNEGFKHSVLPYFKKVLTYVTLFLITAFTTSFFFKYLAKNIIIDNKHLSFIIYCSLISFLFTSLYSLLLFLFVNDSKSLLKRLSLLWK